MHIIQGVRRRFFLCMGPSVCCPHCTKCGCYDFQFDMCGRCSCPPTLVRQSDKRHAQRLCSSFATTAGRLLCLDALTVAIDTTVEQEGRWYTPTNTLELVCLDLCVTCRSCWDIPTRTVTVTADTPRRLWLRGNQGMFRKNKPGAKRVPPVTVRAMAVAMWPRGVQARLREGERRAATKATTGGVLKGCILRLCRIRPSPLWWLHAVQELTFGQFFNQPVVGVVWPPSLQQLSFGDCFNQPIVGIVWPTSLQQLSFGQFFNQTVAGVVWPPSLEQLSLGQFFNKPVAGVVWPASLQQLSFGDDFNQPIAGAVLPASLQQLSFGHGFNRSISGVVWPAFLQQLSFGEFFNQPINEVVWPASLRRLSFGAVFNQPLMGILWPASLQQLRFGDFFYQPIAGVVDAPPATGVVRRSQ